MATAIRAGGRAMTVGDVLSRAFGAIGAAPVALLGTSFLLAALPYALLTGFMRAALLTGVAPGANPFGGGVLATFGATGLVWWLLYLAAKAILILLAVDAIDGRPAMLGNRAGAALRAVLPLAGLSILVTLALSVGFLLFVVPGLILYLVWSVTAPVLVVERSGVFGAFGRSARLTRGARWRILGLVLLVWAIYLVAAGAIGAGGVAAGAMAARGAAPAAPTLVSTILSTLLQTGFIAVWTAIQAALYVELREEKDGPAGERLADIFA